MFYHQLLRTSIRSLGSRWEYTSKSKVCTQHRGGEGLGSRNITSTTAACERPTVTRRASIAYLGVCIRINARKHVPRECRVAITFEDSSLEAICDEPYRRWGEDLSHFRLGAKVSGPISRVQTLKSGMDSLRAAHSLFTRRCSPSNEVTWRLCPSTLEPAAL